MGLEEAIATAMRQSPLLSEKVQEKKAAEEATRAAWGALLPRAEVEVSAQRSSDPSAVVPIKSFGGSPPFFSRDIYSAKLGVAYPLYSGGRLRGRVASARFEKDAALGREILAAQALVADVKVAFCRILAAKELVDAALESRDAARRLRDDARKRYEAGEIALADLRRMETRLAQEEQALVQAEQGLVRARNGLGALIGVGEAVDAEGELTEPTLPVDLDGASIETLIETRQDVKIARAEVSREAENVRVEQAGRLPSVDLVGEYGRKAGSGLDGDEEVWSGGIRLTQMIFDGGITRHKVREAEARYEAARERLRNTRLTARREIIDALSLIQEKRAELAAARSALDAASEAYRLERTRFQNGLSSAADTLLAHADWARSRSNVINALAGIEIAVISYEFATGRTPVPGMEKEGE